MKDYRSNLARPEHIRPAFRHAKPMSWRNVAGHEVLHDPDIFDGCGFMTADEATIVHNIAELNRGRWAVIGSHTGWDTAHIAVAGNDVVAIDPEYSHPGFNKTGSPEFFKRRTEENLEAAACAQRVTLVGSTSAQYFAKCGDLFAGIVIDGEHEPPYPVEDAKMVVPHLCPSAVVIFHDFLGGPVREGGRFLKSLGFHGRIYRTPQVLGVFWRGDIRLPKHQPDTDFDWQQWFDHTLKLNVAEFET